MIPVARRSAVLTPGVYHPAQREIIAQANAATTTDSPQQNPIYYLPLLERNTGSLDRAAPRQAGSRPKT